MANNHITPGMIISLSGNLYRVESSVKVTVAKGTPFVKTKLRDLSTDELIEKNFKVDQLVKDVSLIERRLEFLYLEDRNYLFLDIGNLEQVLVPTSVIGDKVNYLKEGIEVAATFYGETIFSVELPPFLELMVAKTEQGGGGQVALSRPGKAPVAGTVKMAVLETGAKIDVPPFIEAGDIIKVDTKTGEYVQRV